MSSSEPAEKTPNAPELCIHTRDGFTGDICAVLRPYSIHEYVSVAGPHAPYRFEFNKLVSPDKMDMQSRPLTILQGRTGLSVSISHLNQSTPYIWKNVEFEEFHFITKGEFDYVTAYGRLKASPGDFVSISRSVAYRVEPHSADAERLIVELPERIKLAPSLPFGIVNSVKDVVYPEINAVDSSASTEYEIWVRAFDGITRYKVQRDPLAILAHLGGPIPVWKINLENIGQITADTQVAPPAQFAATDSRSTLLFNLSARHVHRPPHHDNADYDEVIVYFRGPGVYGSIEQPGTLTWCPKGVAHQGAEEDVQEGYRAWLIECVDTLRVTSEAISSAHLMETGRWGEHI